MKTNPRYKNFRRDLFEIDAPHGTKGWELYGQARNNRWVRIAAGIEETEIGRARATAEARRQARKQTIEITAW